MRRTLVAAALLAGSLPVLAQSGSSTATTTPFLASITVTATADAEPVDEVPATVTVIPAAEISALRAAEVLPLLAMVPGVATTRAGSPGKLASLFLRGTNSSHTLFLWNGIELNDPYLGGFDLSTLSTDGVERIEVARGPFSALYGSAAVGGVVQILTRRTGRQRSARLELGSNELLRVAASAGGRIGPVHAELAGHARRGEGEVDNDFWDGDELVLALDAGSETSWRGGALLRATRADLGIPFDFAGTPTPARHQDSSALSLALPVAWTDGRWEVEAQVARTETDLEVADETDPFAASRAEARRSQGRLALRWRGAARWTVTWGGDWARAEVDSASAFGPALGGESERIWAAFAQASFARGPMRIDVGVRRDDHDGFGGETSLRAAVALALGERSRLRAAYGESFRAPSLADLYYPGFSNPELGPERGASYELALETERGPLRAELLLFRNDLDGLIEFDFATLRPLNLGRARAEGLEAQAAWRHGWFDARLSATLLDAKDRTSGEPLLRRPDESASIVLFLRPGDWTLGAIGRYVGARSDFGDLPLASYSTLDLSAAFLAGERFEPFARVENVTDERYQEAAGYPAPRRGFVAGCSVRF